MPISISLSPIRFNRFSGKPKSLLGDFVKITDKGSDLNSNRIYATWGYNYEVSISGHNNELNTDTIYATRGADSSIRGGV